MGRPGLSVEEEKAQEDGRLGDFGRRDAGRADGVRLFRADFDQVLHAVRHSQAFGAGGLTRNMQSQERNQETLTISNTPFVLI